MGKAFVAKPKKTGFSPKDIHHGVNFHHCPLTSTLSAVPCVSKHIHK